MTDGPSFNCSKSGISNCDIPAAEDDNGKDDKNEEKQAAMAPRGLLPVDYVGHDPTLLSGALPCGVPSRPRRD
jgi:hypothetical protein